jgi:hypothetical protein
MVGNLTKSLSRKDAKNGKGFELSFAIFALLREMF